MQIQIAIGSSPQVARKHFLQTTDEHFDRAIQGGAKGGTLATQNRAQHTHAQVRTDKQKGDDARRKALASNEVGRSDAKPCENTQEKNGGSAWESNPPEPRLSQLPTVLKTGATTRCASTSVFVFLG